MIDMPWGKQLKNSNQDLEHHVFIHNTNKHVGLVPMKTFFHVMGQWTYKDMTTNCLCHAGTY